MKDKYLPIAHNFCELRDKNVYILLSIPTHRSRQTHIHTHTLNRERLAATLIFALSSNFSSSTGRRGRMTKKKKRERKIKLEGIFVRTAFSKQIPHKSNTKSAAHMVKRFQAQRNTFLHFTLEPITGKLFLLSTSGGLLIRSLTITSCYKAAGYCNLIWTRSQTSRWDDTVVLTSSVKNGYLTQPQAMGRNICSDTVFQVGEWVCVLQFNGI